MTTFINYQTNIFAGLNNIPTIIIEAQTNVLWVTSLIVCNKGPQPIRFNLQKTRRKGFDLERSCDVGTIPLTPLIATYDNGITGVGASLTNNSGLTPLIIDGITCGLNTRILVKDQTDTTQNGIYTVTTAGTTTIPWVITRSTDFDIPSEFHLGDIINIDSGIVNIDSQWELTTPISTIGQDHILFVPNTTSAIYYINELQINSYTTLDVINITGPLNIVFGIKPYVNDKLICFTNGYTQLFDCEVVYAQLNELPYT